MPSTNGWGLLKSRDFGLLWWGQVTSQIGDSLNKVALLWFVYDMTGSALKMTLIGLLQTIPPLVFGPLIGVYLDRLPKKAVMIGVDLLRAVLVTLIPVLYAFGALTLGRLYVLVFVTSIVSTVFGPALVSSMPLLVHRSQYTAANALLQSTGTIGMLIGPAASGIGIALIGPQQVLYANAATFLISALCLCPIRMSYAPQAEEATEPAKGFAQDLLTGFRFVFVQQPTVLLLAIIAGLYHLGVSAFMFLLPVYAKEGLQVGPVTLGWLWSALGAGMLLASVWLAMGQHGPLHERFRTIGRSLTVGGVAVCILGVLETPLLAAGLILIIGGSTALLNPVVWALLQEITPTHLMGRVLTTFSTGSMAAAMAGMMGFGWAADAVGPGASLVALGVLLLLTAAVAIQFSRGRRVGLSPVPASP
jgi:MFS family permease